MTTKHHPTDPNGPLRWVTSSACATSSCVQVTSLAGAILVRSTDRATQVLGFTADEWTAFVEGVKRGEFDVDALAARERELHP